jgi:hypothetical protein
MLFEKALAFALALSMALGSGGSVDIRERAETLLSVPVIDGAEASRELNAAFVSGYTGIAYETVLGDTVHSGSETAFDRLLSGEVDIVIDSYFYPAMVGEYDENSFEYAKETVATGRFELVLPFNSGEESYSYEVYDYMEVFYDKNTKKQNVIDFIEYMLSDEGQASTYLCGFEPIRDIELPLTKKPQYETLGTGEPRPKNFEKSKEYSNITFAYGNYGTDNREDMNHYLLDGDLTNTALEAEINQWIETEIKENNIFEKYGYIGVYCNGINGYLEVVITVAYFEDDDYMPDSPVSVWNLKTGERVTEFSDLFYEGTDFIPAIKKAYEQAFYSPFINLDTEPEHFFITDFLVGDLSYDYIQNAFDDETEEDFHKQPINSMTGIMDLTPIWTYYDMSPHFTEEHLDRENGWGLLRTDKIPDYSLSPKQNKKMLEWRVYSSRFLTEKEIAARNKVLDKIYKYIENSEELADYSESYNLDTTVSISDDLRHTIVNTPFGAYYVRRGNPKVMTAADDVRLSVKEEFIGLVDVDFDGTPEWISMGDTINIYDEDLKLQAKIPAFHRYGLDKYFEFDKWQVIKDTESGKVSGIIYYYCDGKRVAVRYEIESGDLKVTKNAHYEKDPKRESAEKTLFSLGGTQSVTYTQYAFSENTMGFFTGETEIAFDNLLNELQKYADKPYAAVLFEDYTTAYFTSESVKYDGKDVTPSGYSGDIFYFAPVYDVPLIIVEPTDDTLPETVMEYSDGKLKETKITAKIRSYIGVGTALAKYVFPAQDNE